MNETRGLSIAGILFLLVLATLAGVLGQPQQSTNKLYLTPFYNAAMTNGVNTTYNVSVSPQDGITDVKSAIITVEVWMTPTVTFTAWVNGKSCNNPTYTISTTFGGSGLARPNFDCSNIINKTGNYTVTIKPTGANTGASTAWLDLTYTNAPQGKMLLHGTEYIPGDSGKMFLQFTDADNNPVNNSECFLQLWYPNDTIVSGLNYTLMSHLNNLEEGIYYKNFNVPSVSGVYPASAKCYLPLTFNNIINNSATYDGFETGNFTGGYGWSSCNPLGANCTSGWDVEDTVPLATVVTNASTDAPCYNGTYCARYTGSYGFIERGVHTPDATVQANITFWFKFKGFQTNEHAEIWIFDGSWYKIKNIGNAATYGGYTNNVWYQHNITLNASTYHIDHFLLGFYASADTPSTNDVMMVDDVNIALTFPNQTISNITSLQVLRGSGEVHVSNLYSQLANITANGTFNVNTTSIANAVWNYNPRNLTYTEDVTNYTLIGLSVWNSTGLTVLNQTIYRIESLLQNNTLMLQQMNGTLNTINASVLDIDSDLHEMNTTLQVIRGGVTNITSHLLVLNGTVNSINVSTNNILLSIQAINLTVLQNNALLQTINATTTGTNANVTSIKFYLQQMNTTLNGISSDIGILQTDVSSIITDISILQDNVTDILLYERNETTANFSVQLQAIQDSINNATVTINNINSSVNGITTTTNNILTNQSTMYANITISLAAINQILQNLSLNITGSIQGNLTELNNTITGLFTNGNLSVDFPTSTVMLLLYFLLLVLGTVFWKRLPLITLISALYAFFYGISVSVNTNTVLGLVVVCTGFFLTAMFYKGVR